MRKRLHAQEIGVNRGQCRGSDLARRWSKSFDVETPFIQQVSVLEI